MTALALAISWDEYDTEGCKEIVSLLRAAGAEDEEGNTYFTYRGDKVDIKYEGVGQYGH
jgi:hypothetical protein